MIFLYKSQISSFCFNLNVLFQTKWVFNSKPLIFEDADRLKLINVQLHNAGSYKCVVGNIHGTVVKQFTLNVLGKFFKYDHELNYGYPMCRRRRAPLREFNDPAWRSS